MINSIPKLLTVFLLTAPAGSQAEEITVYNGRVEALNRVEVSAQVEGVVVQIHFQPGQRVEEGDHLFSFDDLEFVQRKRTADAVAEKAAALFEDAKQEYDRNQELRERGRIADSRYFKSKAAVAIAAAAVAETNSRLEAAQIELNRTKVYAPISGIISAASVSRGSYVETGRKGVLATIVQLDPVRIAYDIPYPDRLVELGISDLTTIRTYADTVDLIVKLTPDWEHPEIAEPTFLSSDVNPETRSLTAWAVVANPTRTLRPGMDVQVQPVAAENATPKP
jgi:membrane fusion protein (multidrug efflux system)